jgi:hypothetical protein
LKFKSEFVELFTNGFSVAGVGVTVVDVVVVLVVKLTFCHPLDRLGSRRILHIAVQLWIVHSIFTYNQFESNHNVDLAS